MQYNEGNDNDSWIIDPYAAKHGKLGAGWCYGAAGVDAPLTHFYELPEWGQQFC